MVGDNEDKVIGANQMINKRLNDDSVAVFIVGDKQMVKMMRSHVKSFIPIVG